MREAVLYRDGNPTEVVVSIEFIVSISRTEPLPNWTEGEAEVRLEGPVYPAREQASWGFSGANGTSRKLRSALKG